jgi:hypothetical protein
MHGIVALMSSNHSWVAWTITNVSPKYYWWRISLFTLYDGISYFTLYDIIYWSYKFNKKKLNEMPKPATHPTNQPSVKHAREDSLKLIPSMANSNRSRGTTQKYNSDQRKFLKLAKRRSKLLILQKSHWCQPSNLRGTNLSDQK